VPKICTLCAEIARKASLLWECAFLDRHNTSRAPAADQPVLFD